jgi:hypothetical protein
MYVDDSQYDQYISYPQLLWLFPNYCFYCYCHYCYCYHVIVIVRHY